ncbi:MAG: LON peptidase substrate-binding domain-containing protein [Hydrogenophilaceae bacterium]|nr:LON peptidase substrate-binding domain-containing protein [Hydrogenophilaceae bacterium]
MFSSRPRTLPLFPLSTVLFPGGRLTLKIFEQRYLELVKNCLADNSTFGLCAIREGHEVGEPAVPFEVGTEVRITEWDMPQPGIFHIEVEGLERYIANNMELQGSGTLIASIQPVSAEKSCAIPDELRLCPEVLKHIMADNTMPVPESHFEDAVWVGYRLSERLPFKLKVKQDLLEMNDTLTRLRILDQFLRTQAK